MVSSSCCISAAPWLLLLTAVHASARACPAIPSLASYNNTALPDLFTFINGQKVHNLADWACRKQEISTLIQMDELGTLPDPPASMTASFSGSTLTITVSEGGNSITFAPTITYPNTGTAPFPALIGMGGISIPSPAGVAIINFNNEQMAAQDTAASRGQGLFFNLFGSDASAGAMMAWAWAVPRYYGCARANSCRENQHGAGRSLGMLPKRKGRTCCR
ncbi:hypothetical protein MVEN_01004000 [Mycena venus]|uniref:(4-O-methyl)-D-glucuronate--lignin esterase n=1 Tax=Mycena venus TaxID=2733690 RepID=A0A8H6YBI1_9AGAR|nr:hypothetical protein MVEN_01004000 [Mycena venus]